MRRTVLCLLTAEVSAAVTVEVISRSPLSLFIPVQYLYLIFLAPPILALLKRNPYDISLFTAFLILSSFKAIANSKIIYSISNALYYLGFKGISERIALLFSAYRGADLLEILIITATFVIAQIVWHSDEKNSIRVFLTSTTFAFASILALLELSNVSLSGYPILLGIAGVILVVLAIYLLLS